jgi:hypothetical protein
MKLSFKILSISLLLLSCTEPIITDPNDIKGFFSQLEQLKKAEQPGFYISGRPLIVDSIVVDEGMFMETAKKEPLFSKVDVEYIKGQLAADTQGTWRENLFDSIKVVPRTYIDKLAESDSIHLTPPYIELSKPYFSKDKQYCIFYYSYYCGNLCAEKTLKLYKRVNGRWTVVRNYYQIVS